MGVLAVEPDSRAVPAISSIRVLDGTGDRSVVSVNAIARAVAAPDWLPGVLDAATVLLLDGHHPRLAVTAARAARERDVPVVLDAGSWRPVLDELLPLVDIAICSADFRLPDGAHPADLLALGVPRVAISRGGQPMLCWSAGGGGPVTVPVRSVPVRDTLGAGDVLHGAFARALADSPRAAFPQLLESAARIATERCSHLGISSWRNHLLREGPTDRVGEVVSRPH